MKHIVTALALFVASTAHAYIYTGNALFERLQSSDVSDRRVALAYISGVTDGLDQVTHCLPIGVSSGANP